MSPTQDPISALVCLLARQIVEDARAAAARAAPAPAPPPTGSGTLSAPTERAEAP